MSISGGCWYRLGKASKNCAHKAKKSAIRSTFVWSSTRSNAGYGRCKPGKICPESADISSEMAPLEAKNKAAGHWPLAFLQTLFFLRDLLITCYRKASYQFLRLFRRGQERALKFKMWLVRGGPVVRFSSGARKRERARCFARSREKIDIVEGREGPSHKNIGSVNYLFFMKRWHINLTHQMDDQ